MPSARTSWTALTLLALAAAVLPSARAQISLTAAVDLALRNSPKVRVAQADVDKASALLSQARDAYIPSITTTGGVGKSTGAPLGVPVAFSISAQSLVFNFSQHDNIRAASAGLEAARHALNDVRLAVAEDTAVTYLQLDNATQRRAVLGDEGSIAGHIVQISTDRFQAGVDPQVEVHKSQRTAVQVRLLSLTLDNEIEALAEHLANLTGLPARGLTTTHDSVPAIQPIPAEQIASAPTGEGIEAAFSNARAKHFLAHGEKHYLFLPQLGFAANYSRINTAFSNYTQYYPRFGAASNSQNSLGLGVQLSVPLFDMVHLAHRREVAADAARAFAEAESQRSQFLEGRTKLRHAAAELQARAELASLDRDLAKDQLEAVQIQLQASAAGSQNGQQMNPRDAESAHLQERQRTYEMLDAEIQLRQAQINLMRQTGQLTDWLHSAVIAPVNATVTTAPAPTN